MNKQFRTRLRQTMAPLLTLALTLSGGLAHAADSDLDTAINDGFGKLVKYGRWTGALILGVLFVLSWAERGQNQDNPHEMNRATRKMMWTGLGFVAVIGYRMILTGLTAWFNINPASIPAFLWQ